MNTPSFYYVGNIPHEMFPEAEDDYGRTKKRDCQHE